MNSALRLLGIARKAGRLEMGEEPVAAAARAHQARVILLASDAADNSVRRAGHFAQGGNTVLVETPFTKAELGAAVGRTACAMLAVTDAGLASAFVEKLARENPERWGEAAQALSAKAQKVLQRQKEKRAHEKNLRRAGKKPWAAPPKPSEEKKKPGKGKKPAGKSSAPSAQEEKAAPRRPARPRGKIQVKRAGKRGAERPGGTA